MMRPEEQLLIHFIKNGFSLGLAESCTGGAICARLTQIPQASEYLKGAIVCYQTLIKTQLLNVSEAALKQYTVYSPEVAAQMALGLKSLLSVDVALSTTGVAGPSSSNGIPVGTVFMGLVTPKDKVQTFKFIFSGSRQEIIAKTTETAIRLIIEKIS